MTDPLSKTNSLRVDAGEPTSVATAGHHNGLTSDEASLRVKKLGPNAMPDTSEHPLRMALEKFWARVPWMLEAAFILELVLGKYVEAAVIAALLVFNASWVVPGEPRTGNPHRAQVAARA